MSRGVRIGLVVAVAAAFVVVAVLVLGSSDSGSGPASGASGSGSDGGSLSDGGDDLAAALRERVTIEGVVEHLEALQEIANANEGNRAAGTSGYSDSVSYVAERLRDAGYDVEFQDFVVPVFEHLSDPVLAAGRRSLEDGDDYAVMLYSGSGRVSGPVVPVDLDLSAPSSTSGCEATDFASFPSGAVALVRRGNCFFRDQAANAAAAQAVGVLVSQEPGAPGVLRGTLTPDFEADIPVMGITNSLARTLATSGGRVRLSIDAVIEDRASSNVLASTSSGSDSEVIMVGAHLDSVPGGPGINDNGSGSAVVLEVAEAIASFESPTRVRFAWWGGEEFGLLGSAHYVLGLSESEQDEIATYLNFDMLGSPNYVRFVYDGRNAGATDVDASVAIQEMFQSYFASQSLATDLIPLEGRSDHALFARVGIPIGGLFSGADDVKTADDVEVYGGEEGVIQDPCYHLACDAIDNVNTEILEQMADGVAHGVGTLATDPAVVLGGG